MQTPYFTEGQTEPVDPSKAVENGENGNGNGNENEKLDQKKNGQGGEDEGQMYAPMQKRPFDPVESTGHAASEQNSSSGGSSGFSGGVRKILHPAEALDSARQTAELIMKDAMDALIRTKQRLMEILPSLMPSQAAAAAAPDAASKMSRLEGISCAKTWQKAQNGLSKKELTRLGKADLRRGCSTDKTRYRMEQGMEMLKPLGLQVSHQVSVLRRGQVVENVEQGMLGKAEGGVPAAGTDAEQNGSDEKPSEGVASNASGSNGGLTTNTTTGSVHQSSPDSQSRKKWKVMPEESRMCCVLNLLCCTGPFFSRPWFVPPTSVKSGAKSFSIVLLGSGFTVVAGLSPLQISTRGYVDV
ncbi:hypothetical protein AXG93_2789s1090 [Marchantia polymorpha subsp. ruderalis]|uniref:Uncharacterized protein n=1 Tax=Marchantia polymorpha subsp. ruderalis TaxID=1480154 RepID=A0A176W870_MARPO|nr:hypothetical protein AXG93_2789s1090 [Marchantia polymorpha subsp. ruderalis]